MGVIDDRFPRLLKEGRPLAGLFTGIPSASLIEMAGFAGFDFVIIDNEHGPASIETTEQMVRAAQYAGITPLVRVSCANPQEILRTLDTGAAGVQVPQVNTADEARQVVSASKFPPAGTRGAAFSSRAAGFGFFGGANYLRSANEQTVVITHIETLEAVGNIDAMLAVPGIDVMFIGPTDLSVSMGYPGNTNHPEVQARIASAAERILASGVVLGILCTSPEEFHRYVALGARYLAITAPGLIGGAMRRYVEAIQP